MQILQMHAQELECQILKSNLEMRKSLVYIKVTTEYGCTGQEGIVDKEKQRGPILQLVSFQNSTCISLSFSFLKLNCQRFKSPFQILIIKKSNLLQICFIINNILTVFCYFRMTMRYPFYRKSYCFLLSGFPDSLPNFLVLLVLLTETTVFSYGSLPIVEGRTVTGRC